jgi:hypothetical protein
MNDENETVEHTPEGSLNQAMTQFEQAGEESVSWLGWLVWTIQPFCFLSLVAALVAFACFAYPIYQLAASMPSPEERTEAGELQRRYEEAMKQNAELNEKLDKLDSEMEALQGQLDEKEQEIPSPPAEATRPGTEAPGKDQEVLALKKERDDLLQKLDRTEQERDDATQQLTLAQDRAAKAEGARAYLESKNAGLQARYEAAEERWHKTLQDQVDKLKVLPPSERREQLLGLLNQMEQLFVPQGNDQDPFIVRRTAEVLHDAVVEDKFALRLDNLNTTLGQLKTSTDRLIASQRRELQPEHVVLLAFDSPEVRAKAYEGVLRRLIEDGIDVTMYANYQWGVYPVSNDSVLDPILPLGAAADGETQSMAIPGEGQPPDPENFQPKKIFEQATNGGEGAVRRCVLILTPDGAPPQIEAPSWEGIEVDAVIVTAPGPQEDVQRRTKATDRWWKWDQFCKAKNGEALLLEIQPRNRSNEEVIELTQASENALRLRLQRLLHPRRTVPPKP